MRGAINWGMVGMKKKILFIANFNNVMKEVSQALMEYFQVQVSAANEGSVKGILTMYEPDIVVISLTGLGMSDSGLYYLVSAKASNIPVLTIGTESESRACSQYYEEQRFKKLLRPISNNEIIVEICKALKLDLLDELQMEEEEADVRKHILCVDDSGAMLRKLQDLIPEDYRVSIVNSGTKAIAMIEKDRPDLIFLDYDMPIVDGRQTLEMIRSEEAMASIPVVFMTGKNDRESIESVIALRPAGYLLKPPNKNQMLERIISILGR